MKKKANEYIRSIFNMPNREDAEYMFQKAVEKYTGRTSEFAEWLKREIPEGLTVSNLVADTIGVGRKLRTTDEKNFKIRS